MSERLKEIRERVEKATPGPWHACMYQTIYRGDMSTHVDLQKDRDFIARARDDIPWLLNRIEELENAVQEQRRQG